MPGYTREQLDNIRKIKSTPAYKAASPRERKALFEATAVESNHRDLNYGDRDSKGILQQRNNGAWGAAKEDVATDASQFLAAAKAANTQGGSAGQLAQRVQRSAFPGRYDEHSKEADKLVGSATKGRVRALPMGTAPTLTEGGTKTDTRGAVQAALLDKRKGMSLVSRMQEAISSGKFTTSTLPEVTPGKVSTNGVKTAKSPNGDTAKARADAIDEDKLPYLWGGGHAGKVKDVSNAAPLDCSGAVSAVLGINPRVSGEFTKWGKAGDGGSKGVTVYANGEHVLMKINGHFFGTSASNPGGGAGWIKQSKITPAYLKGFTARHD
jgi:hypothetical protein